MKIKIINNKIIKSLLLITTLFLSIIYFQSIYAKTQKEKDEATYNALKRLSKVLSIVRSNYVTIVDEEELIDDAIRGLVGSLDPHSKYFNEKEFQSFYEKTKGEFSGVGLTIQKDPETKFIKVVSPIEGGPGFKAGIEPSDLIISIEKKSTFNMSLEEVVKLLKGEKGTDVNIQIINKKKERKDITLTRAIIEPPSVLSRVEREKYGYLRISSFQQHTTEQLHKELKKLESKNLKGYVLDLRYNPGGLLTQAVSVSDTFLKKGKMIVSTKGRIASSRSESKSKTSDMINNKPLVILVNGGSASASEIVSGALQDHKRALIIGTQTFGKGSVQSIVPLSQKTAVKFTTALYYTPNDKSIQQIGIKPDIVVEQLDLGGKVLAQSKRTESSLKGSIKNNQIDSTKEEGKNNEVKKEKPTDYQLSRALDSLQVSSFQNQTNE